MTLYLVRAGHDGQFENRFISDSRIYLQWGNLFADRNIAQIGDYEAIKQAALAEAPNEKPKAIINGVSKINTFVHRIAKDDWVVLPLKHKSALIARKFKGHAMERLVEGILNAQGYKTWRTSGGADGNMDILALKLFCLSLYRKISFAFIVLQACRAPKQSRPVRGQCL